MKAGKVKDLLSPCASACGPLSCREAEYLNLLANAVDIVGEDGKTMPIPERDYLMRQLFVTGKAGFHGLTKGFYRVAALGQLNRLGNYDAAEFITENGYSFRVPLNYEPKENGNYLIKALPFQGVTFLSMISESVGFIDAAYCARRQNLDACKTPYIVVCRDENTRLSLKQALEQKEDGQAAIIVSPELGDALKGVNIETPYLVDKFDEAASAEENRLMTKLGILTANTGKRERVQSAEVNATLGQATDYIYMLIDYFNKQMETYELPYEMVYNGSMEELYEDGSDTPVNDQKEQQTEGAENGFKGN